MFADEEHLSSTTEILESLPVFQNSLTHLELAFYRFEHRASVSHLGETLKSFKKLQFLALSVDITVIKEGHLESALRDLTHLELYVINKRDDDTTVPEDLLEFKSLKQLRSLTNWKNDDNMTAVIGGWST